jgi:hypothetical protein
LRVRLAIVALPLILSAAAWAVVFAAFPPRNHRFPLIDEWAFAREALDFARGGGIHYDGWASMPQLGQWLWSVPFVAAFGANLFALRLSTIVLGWLGLVAFYDLLRQLNVAAWQAAFATAAFALNPLFFLAQGTYMTDVPAVSFALMALCLYGRAFQRHDPRLLAPAAIVAVLGAMTREHAIAAPLTAGIVLAGTRELRRRAGWVISVLAPVMVGAATHFWFMSRPDIQPMPPEVPDLFRLAFTPWFIIHTLGLAALPVLLLDPWPRSWPRFGIALAATLGIAYFWYKHGDLFAFDGLFPYTIGLIDPHGVYSMNIVVGATARDAMLSLKAEALLTLAGCVGAAALIDRLPTRLRGGNLLLIFGLFQTIPLFVTRALYDRYLIFLIPSGLYVVLTDQSEVVSRAWRRIRAEAALALFALASVGLMHDWLAWNTARWNVGRRAIERGIDPWDIEGGFEWNGWYGPKPVPKRKPKAKPDGEAIMLRYTAEQFYYVRGRYALSFSVLKRTVPLDAEPFHLWMKRGTRQIFLVKRLAPERMLVRAQSP